MIPVPPEVLVALSAQYGMNPSELRKFGGGQPSSDGIVYERIKGGDPVLLKVMPFPPGDAQPALQTLDARLSFARYLGDHGARIAFPLTRQDGSLYATYEHRDRTWVAYTMKKMPGQVQNPRGVDHDFIHKWGAAVGHMHKLATTYPTWRGIEDPATGHLKLNWEEEVASFTEWCSDPVGKQAWKRMRERLAVLPVERESFGFIHNDPHLWNLLYDFEHITVLDFDVANHHWFMTDVAIACQHVLFMQSGGLNKPLHHKNRLVDFLAHFKTGYETQYTLPAVWWNRIDLFIAYRRLLMFTVSMDNQRVSQKHLSVMHALLREEPEIMGEWVR